MRRYAIWNKKTDIITPIGEVLTPEQWIERYPWIRIEGLVPVVAAGVFSGGLIAELSQMKSMCEAEGATFEDGLTNEELLSAIEAFEDTRNKEAASEVSAEERIAAALEYQNMLAE